MESGEGTGLIKRHAHLLNLEKKLGQEIDVKKLSQEFPTVGGDYLRIWSRVLIEDDNSNLGGRFDAFYFVGPNDVWDFFNASYGQRPVKDLTRGVEDYFASKFTTNADFRAYFGEAREMEDREKDFFRF
jgi:hypothetical protein